MNIVYLNGQFIEKNQAKISVLDRGFLFADGVYEVIPIYQHKLFEVEAHLKRLANSCEGIDLVCPLSQAAWLTIFEQLLSTVPLGNYALYLQVTRGAPEIREHIFPAEPIQPTVYVQLNPLNGLFCQQRKLGLSAITTEDLRWKRCNIKSIALLPNVLAREKAKKQGADEAILIREGFVTEASISNVFIVKNNLVKTPPLDNHILPGITRSVILKIANQLALPYEEVPIPQEALFEADEIWITSSSKEVAPVTLLDNRSIGTGKPGKMWEKVFEAFQSYKNT